MATALGTVLLVTGCVGTGYPTCSSAPVTHHDGSCSAYYYQTDRGKHGVTTQALVDCVVGDARVGGDIVAFKSSRLGVGLRWTDPHNLEVSVPKGVHFLEKRTIGDYAGYRLNYTYRTLLPGEPASAGCAPGRREGGT